MLKLSEAIRAGALMSPASHTGWFDKGPHGEVRTCALMAALEATELISIKGGSIKVSPTAEGGPVVDPRTGKSGARSVLMPIEWEKITTQYILPPCMCAALGGKELVYQLVLHLHDVHNWTREAVAEWIETLEEKWEKLQKSLEEYARRKAAGVKEEVNPETIRTPAQMV